MRIGPSEISNTLERAAFTLVELIVVMTMIVITLSMVAPRLTGFFKGRNLDNESHQFLALTRYGLSRAVGEGVPMMLWLDLKRNQYGLAGDSGFAETKTNAMVFHLDAQIQLQASAPHSLNAANLTRSNYWTQTAPAWQKTTAIRFQPDGFIGDSSPKDIIFSQDDGSLIWIAETPDHKRYEIQPGRPNFKLR